MVDVSKFNEQNKQSGNSNNIVFVGRLVERKGAKYLIKAFSLILKNHPTMNLLIAGDGPDKLSLMNQAKQLGIADKVSFLGFISEQEKSQLLSTARIACFPSLYGESFGIVLIEAMAAGAQVVMGGDNQGYRSVLKDSKTLFDPRDIKNFAAKLSAILEDEQQAGLLHQYQQAEYKQYDIEVVGSTIEQIYYQQIAKTTNRRHN
jgi:phosphatidylinositol alpha-mannosyltransferase